MAAIGHLRQFPFPALSSITSTLIGRTRQASGWCEPWPSAFLIRASGASEVGCLMHASTCSSKSVHSSRADNNVVLFCRLASICRDRFRGMAIAALLSPKPSPNQPPCHPRFLPASVATIGSYQRVNGDDPGPSLSSPIKDMHGSWQSLIPPPHSPGWPPCVEIGQPSASRKTPFPRANRQQSSPCDQQLGPVRRREPMEKLCWPFFRWVSVGCGRRLEMVPYAQHRVRILLNRCQPAHTRAPFFPACMQIRSISSFDSLLQLRLLARE